MSSGRSAAANMEENEQGIGVDGSPMDLVSRAARVRRLHHRGEGWGGGEGRGLAEERE